MYGSFSRACSIGDEAMVISPTASLDLTFCLSPLSVRKIGMVIALLHPRNQLQYVVNGRSP